MTDVQISGPPVLTTAWSEGPRLAPLRSLLSSVEKFLSVALFISCAPVLAQGPVIETRLATESDIWVGENVTLIVELKVPGVFSGAPVFDLPEVPGMILVPPTDRPLLSTENIGDIAYTVQRHELAVWVRNSGKQTIPAFPVRFGFKRSPLDKETVSARLKTTALELAVRTPPGAEGLSAIISARDLKAGESWEPESDAAKEGDAFTRTIHFSAPDIPAMAFPPFTVRPIDGLGIYPQEPELNDRSERGSATGERTERITYVCEREGEFIIPAVKFTWFDLDAKELRVVEFPERVLSVAPNPQLQKSADAASPRKTPTEKGDWFWLSVGIVLILAVFWKLGSHRRIVRLLSHLRPVHLEPLKPSPTNRDRKACGFRDPCDTSGHA